MRELTEYEEKIVAEVEQHRCYVIQVFDPDGIAPNFSYSIGFPALVAQPEVIVFGLSIPLMHSMIDEIYRQCRHGLSLNGGLRVAGLINGHDCELRSVKPKHIVKDHFNSAMWFHRHRTGEPMTEAFQIVWPGAVDGLFPWDEGASQDVIDAQPALYECVR